MGLPIGPCAAPPAPPCPPLSITAAAAGVDAILVTVVSGGPADITLGGQTALGVTASHTFTLLDPSTTYPVEATSECGARATAVARTDAVPVVPPPPVYCPSLRLDTGSCGAGCSEAGFAYRDNTLRDPAATVAVPHCNGETSYIYPTAGMFGAVRAEVPYYGGGTTVLGYLANNSDCAPPVQACVVNRFSPTIEVAPPVNNITLPAPSLVAHSMAPDGTLTSTLSNGEQVVSNAIPVVCP